jgi:hypothetical protein
VGAEFSESLVRCSCNYFAVTAAKKPCVEHGLAFMSLSVCVCVCVCIYICVCMCICVYIYAYSFRCGRASSAKFSCVYIVIISPYLQTRGRACYMDLLACLCVCVGVYIYIYVCVCICIYIYIYI